MIRVAAVYMFLVTGGSCYALFSLLDGQLNAVAEITEQYDSNIASSPTNPVEDLILSFRPGLTYERKNGLLGITGDFGLEVGRFLEDRRLNYENLQLQLGLEYPLLDESKLKTSFNARFMENSTPDPILGERVESELFNLEGSARYDFLPIYGIAVNAAKSETKSVISTSGNRLSDVGQESLTGQFFYRYSDLLELNVSYRIRDNLIAGVDTDTISISNAQKMSGEDEALSIGFDGQLTSLLTGTLQVGAQKRSFNDGRTAPVGIFSSTSLSWQLSPERTSVTLVLNSDTTPTPVNDSIEAQTASLTVDHTFSAFLSGSAGASYGVTEFTDTLSAGPGTPPRNDITHAATIGLTYLFSEYITASVMADHTWTTTNAGNGYKRSTAQCAFDLKF